ncbi:MAG: hypothetical protein ABI556_15960 [Gemmatimonadales bacterium]
MIRRSTLSRVVVACALLLAGCAKQSVTAAKPPTPAEAFMNTIAAANKRAEAGDYLGADRILADFALKSRGTDDATEISFWRALYMVDPSNKTASIPEGLRAIDIYLSTPGAKMYKPQALVLKRTAQSVQALKNAQIAPKISGRDTVYVTREEEIAALKDQLAKANAELDRIKKRLANPER